MDSWRKFFIVVPCLIGLGVLINDLIRNIVTARRIF